MKKKEREERLYKAADAVALSLIDDLREQISSGNYSLFDLPDLLQEVREEATWIIAGWPEFEA